MYCNHLVNNNFLLRASIENCDVSNLVVADYADPSEPLKWQLGGHGGEGRIGCVYLTHTLQKPCSTTTMAVYAIYEATAKKLEFASGKSGLATLFSCPEQL